MFCPLRRHRTDSFCRISFFFIGPFNSITKEQFCGFFFSQSTGYLIYASPSHMDCSVGIKPPGFTTSLLRFRWNRVVRVNWVLTVEGPGLELQGGVFLWCGWRWALEKKDQKKNVKIAYFNRRKSRRIIFRMSYDNGSQSVGRALPRANLLSSTFVSQ